MTTFAKRHYEAVARALQDARRLNLVGGHEQAVAADQWRRVRDTLADTFARDNGSFNRDRFARACEPGANVRARSSNPPVQDVGTLSGRLAALREAAE